MKILFFSLALIGTLAAENIHLNDGKIYKNVQIVSTEENYIIIKFNDGRVGINRTDVLKIDNIPYNPSAASTLEFNNDIVKKSSLKSTPIIKHTKQPYLYLLPVAALSLAITWDSFSSASDIGTTIDNYKKLGLDTGTLEASQTRKYIVGAVAAVTSIILTVVGLKSVEVKGDNNMLSLSFNF